MKVYASTPVIPEEHRWFASLSHRQQLAYLKKHPNSEYAANHGANAPKKDAPWSEHAGVYSARHHDEQSSKHIQDAQKIEQDLHRKDPELTRLKDLVDTAPTAKTRGLLRIRYSRRFNEHPESKKYHDSVDKAKKHFHMRGALEVHKDSSQDRPYANDYLHHISRNSRYF